MLLEFSFGNFKSFGKEVTLSMVANPSDALAPSHCQEVALKPKGETMQVLLGAAIYGANASGKSGVLDALGIMRYFVCKGHLLEPESGLEVHPHRFHENFVDNPTTFEVILLIDGIKYQYGFSATSQRIQNEWLFAFPKGRVQKWFERDWNEASKNYDYSFSEKLMGHKEVWRTSTIEKRLFLNTAVNLNSEMLKPVYEWFSMKAKIFGMHDCSALKLVTDDYCSIDAQRMEVLDFLNGMDFDKIEEITLEESITQEVINDLKSKFKDKEVVDRFIDLNKKNKRVAFIHKNARGKQMKLPLAYESEGTQKLYELAALWLQTLKNGGVIVIDELHAHLHPLLMEYLVSMFFNKKFNKKGAQLIFTTHETSILSSKLLRRDQVWFCEKDRFGCSDLYPLTDFKIRKGTEDFRRSYLKGKFGALPILSAVHDKFENS